MLLLADINGNIIRLGIYSYDHAFVYRRACSDEECTSILGIVEYVGYRTEFLTYTKGNGIMNSVISGFEPFAGDIETRGQGVLVAFETGTAVTYGLYNAQDRGALFIGAGTPVYEGMIVGINPKPDDITVNVCKKKHVTNMRSAGADDAMRLTPPLTFSLEQCLEFVEDDELCEVTPQSIRLRKKILNNDLRAKTVAKAKKDV